MWLTRLTSQFVRATRLSGYLAPRCSSVIENHGSVLACYSTRQPNRPQTPAPIWYSLEPELDDLLVPRRMSVSPLESMLSTRYSLPKPEVFHSQEEPQEQATSYECPSHQDTKDMEEDREERGVVQCKNVLKIRRRKMNKHKYKKLQKRVKFLRRKIKDGRRRRRQARFEKDLKRIWKKAGLEKPPEGWQPPKIYVKH
ncbi:small ribosomal subunit protein mS38 [Rhinophrynus dorsalis]